MTAPRDSKNTSDPNRKSVENLPGNVLDNLLEGYQVIRRDWKYLYINDAAARQGRSSKEQLLGRTMIEAYPGIDDTPMFAVLRQCMHERTVHQMENEFTFPDGAKGWFELRFEPVPEGVFILSMEISERKRAEEALRESESKYRKLVEMLQEGIWAIDREAFTTFVNPRMAEILGYEVEEMQGKQLFSFMDERGAEIAKRNLERRKQGIKEEHDFEFLRKDGSRIYTTLATGPITDDQGNYLGAIAGVIDITERRRTEEQLSEMNEKLLQAQKMEAVGRLAGGVAHDFNNILTAIYGYCDILLARVPEGQAEHSFAAEIRKAAVRAA